MAVLIKVVALAADAWRVFLSGQAEVTVEFFVRIDRRAEHSHVDAAAPW